MNGKPVMPEPCQCGGTAMRLKLGAYVGLQCSKCQRETHVTALRTEAALDAVANEWNAGNGGKGEVAK